MLKKLLSLFKRKPRKPTEAQIHREFETCADNWLSEYYRRTSEYDSIMIDTGLKKQSEKDAIDLLAEKTDAIQKELRAELDITRGAIEYYRKFYRVNSYLTNAMVGELCEKYNLVCDYIGKYNGVLNDQNLVASEFFQEPDETDQIHFYKLGAVQHSSAHYSWYEFCKLRPNCILTDEDCDGSYSQGMLLYAKPKDGNGKYVVSRDFTVLNPPMMVCAPAADFRLKTDPPDLKKRNKPSMADPIILKPVKNGYLLVNMLNDRVAELATKEILHVG